MKKTIFDYIECYLFDHEDTALCRECKYGQLVEGTDGQAWSCLPKAIMRDAAEFGKTARAFTQGRKEEE